METSKLQILLFGLFVFNTFLVTVFCQPMHRDQTTRHDHEPTGHHDRSSSTPRNSKIRMIDPKDKEYFNDPFFTSPPKHGKSSTVVPSETSKAAAVTRSSVTRNSVTFQPKVADLKDAAQEDKVQKSLIPDENENAINNCDKGDGTCVKETH